MQDVQHLCTLALSILCNQIYVSIFLVYITYITLSCQDDNSMYNVVIIILIMQLQLYMLSYNKICITALSSQLSVAT